MTATRAVVIAEAASDARVIRQLAERFLFDAGPQWVREVVDGGGWSGLLAFEGREGEACWTWGALKRKVNDGTHPRQLRRAAGAPQENPLVGRVAHVCRILGHHRALVHADAADVESGFADALRALPDLAVAAGDHGLAEPAAAERVVRDAPIERLRARDDLAAFAADVVRVLGSVWAP